MSVANVLRLGYGVGGNAGLVLRLGYDASVTPPVPVPMSLPGPADAPDDIARRRWLEWRDRKRRKRVVERVAGVPAVQPTRSPEPPPVVERPAPRIIDATPVFELLARNHAAMREQQEARERRRREEEDLLALLLEGL